MARVYQSTISCTKERTGRDMGVRCRAAMTMPTRKVMARKRTRPSHESHSFTLGVDFISDFSPRYERALLCVASLKPAALRKLPSASLPSTGRRPRRRRLDAHAASAARVLVACQFADQREQRQVHGNDDAADDHAQDDDHDGLHGGQQVFHGRVDFVFVKVGDFLQHGVHRAGLLADADHLGNHARKYAGVLQRINQGASSFDGLAGLGDGALDDRVTGGARGDVQTFQDGHAAGDQSAERPGEAGDGDLSHERTDQRNFQNDRVNRHAALRRAIPGLQGEHATRNEQGDDETVDAADEIAEHDDDARRQRQVHAPTVEELGKNRHDLPQQQDDDAAGNAHDGGRINHGGLHGALELDVLFNVAGEALENGVQNTARLAGFDHVVVQRVEDLLVLLHGSGKSGAAFDRAAHAIENLLEGDVLLLSSENLQALHQGQTGVNHDGELAGEDGQLLRVHAAAEGGDIEFLALFGELADGDLLPLQGGLDFSLGARRAFALYCGARLISSAICKHRHD